VIPLLPKSKVPYASLLPKGKDGKASWGILRQHPATHEMVEQWFRQDPAANYAIATGQPFGLAVVDIDDREKLPPGLILMPTYMVFSGREGGAQMYYRYKGPLKSRSFPWGDLLTDGKYVVGPGSVHPNKKTYEALDPEARIAEMPRGLLKSLSEDDEGQGLGEEDTISRFSISRFTSPSDPVKDWQKLFYDPEVAFEILKVCGVEVRELGRAFKCPWCDDDDDHPSAALYQRYDESGVPQSPVFLHDFHFQGKAGWIPLPDLYARFKSGRRKRLKAPERAVWGVRALAETGSISLPNLDSPSLPNDTPDSARRLMAGFQELLRVRQVCWSVSGPAPYSWDFASRWCRMSKPTVQTAIGWLRDKGYLIVSPAPPGEKCQLYSIVGGSVEEKTVADVEGGTEDVGAEKLDSWRVRWLPQPVLAVLGDLAHERSVRHD
jgi:hypothetical protein